MNDPTLQPVAGAPAPGLTQMQRVTNVFTAPSKVFKDIANGNRSWWLPFLIMIAVTYLFFATVTVKVGWDQVSTNLIQQNPKAQERMANAPPAQRETIMKFTRMATEGAFLATPLIALIVVALGSLVLMATINFGFGGKAKFADVFSLWFYARLPALLKLILGMIALLAGMAPESFNMKNFAPTNAGAFLNPADIGNGLYTLLTAIDVIDIWTIFLLGMGLAIVAGKKSRGSGYAAVFGWWVLITLISVGFAAISG